MSACPAFESHCPKPPSSYHTSAVHNITTTPARWRLAGCCCTQSPPWVWHTRDGRAWDFAHQCEKLADQVSRNQQHNSTDIVWAQVTAKPTLYNTNQHSCCCCCLTVARHGGESLRAIATLHMDNATRRSTTGHPKLNSMQTHPVTAWLSCQRNPLPMPQCGCRSQSRGAFANCNWVATPGSSCTCKSAQSGCARFAPLPLLPVLLLLLLPPLLLLLSLGVCSYAG